MAPVLLFAGWEGIVPPMRIAYICADKTLAVLGSSGRAAYIQEVLRALSREGAQIDIFAARLDGDRPEGLRSLVVHKLSLFGGDLGKEETAMVRANHELRRLLDGARGGHFSLVLERFSPWSCAGSEYAKALKIPYLLEVTNFGLEELAHLPEKQCEIAAGHLKSATVAIAASDEIAEALNGFGIRSVRISGSVDPERYSTGARLTIRKTGAFTVGYLGNLNTWDVLIPLVEAFSELHRKHPEARLVIEGDGSAKTRMIAELSRRGLLGTTCFLGKLPARRISGMLAAVDVSVACSSEDDVSIRDSMLAGVPVLSTVPTALVQDHINGRICLDAQSLQAALLNLCSERILRLRLGSNARRSLIGEGTWTQIAHNLLKTIQSSQKKSLPQHPDFPSTHATL